MDDIAARVRAGDERAVARAITLVEAGAHEGQELLRALRPFTGRARVVGITGAPGSGKSTLTDRLIAVARARDMRVGVVAVDPSSPFSGGAILGDRIRMTRWHDDDGVFIRSMATRGRLGGLAAGSLQVVAILDAAGFDMVLIETVGVGQSEVDIVEAADTTVLVLTPGAGDGVQAFKAGIMEIADVFCINKDDLPDAGRLKREVRAAIGLARLPEGAWRPPIVGAVALDGTGVETLFRTIESHAAFLAEHGRLEQRRRRRVRFEILAIVGDSLRLVLADRGDEAIDAVLSGRATPYDVIRTLWPSALHEGATARPRTEASE